jgi:hypothetical protein
MISFDCSRYGWDDAYWWEGNKDGVVGFFPCHSVQWVEPEGEAAVNVSAAGEYPFFILYFIFIYFK